MPNWHLKQKYYKRGLYMAKKEEIVEVTNETEIEVTSVTVSGMIHIIRGKQVILDSDLTNRDVTTFNKQKREILFLFREGMNRPMPLSGLFCLSSEIQICTIWLQIQKYVRLFSCFFSCPML